MKPKWADVPEGYDWIAQDKNGRWYSYLKEPRLYTSSWSSCSPWNLMNRDLPNPHWRNTLEKRPEIIGYTFGQDISDNDTIYRDKIFALFTGGTKMNSCPTTRELTPLERINAKQERLSDEITALADRVDALDDIKLSVKWKDATPEMQDKAVEAADRV